MSVKYLAYRSSRQWRVTYRNPWSGKLRIQSFDSEEKAYNFQTMQDELYQKEKDLIRKARKKAASSFSRKISLNDLIEQYVNSLKNPSTNRSTHDHVESILELFGKRKSYCITIMDIHTWMDIQRQRGVGQSTICRRASILRAAYNWGIKTRTINVNPIAGLSIPTAKSRRLTPPSFGEARLMREVAAPHVQRVITLGMSTGVRVGPSELFKLRWTDVDTANGVIRITNAHKGANTESREVPIRDDILDTLKRWRQEDSRIACPYVIHFRGKPVRSISKAWHTALRRAGITRRIRPYDLRHAFASHSLAYGADIKSVSEVMGHCNPGMLLKIYQHTTFRQRKKAVNAAPGVLSGPARILSGRVKYAKAHAASPGRRACVENGARGDPRVA